MSTQVRQRDPRHAYAEVSPAAKLALVEICLGGADLATSVRAALQWLGQHTDAEVSFCAVLDDAGERLVGLAGDGVSHAQCATFSVPVEDHGHPLVAALSHGRPIRVQEAHEWRPAPPGPLLHTPFFVITLSAPLAGDHVPVGVLLLAGLETAQADELSWATRLLAERVFRHQLEGARLRERRLLRERGLLYQVLNAVPDPVLLTDEKERIHVANTYADKLLAVENDASEGRRRAVSLNNMLFSAALFPSGEEDARARREVLLVDPIQGDDLLFELIRASVKMPEGGEGFVSVLRDVTDLRQAAQEIDDNFRRQRRAEREMRAERDRLDLILNAVAGPVLVTSPDGVIMRMNPPAKRLFTLDPKYATEKSARRVRANDAMLSSFVSHLWTSQVLRWRGELNLVDPLDGEPLPFEANAGKAIAGDGGATGVVTILHDRREAIEKARLFEQVMRHSDELKQRVEEATCELVEQNEVLRRQAVQLEQASEAKSQFLANMSHELRTPLNAVLGYTALLQAGISGPLAPKQAEQIGRVDANARHLLALIEDLLEIARIEAGQLRLSLSSVDPAELISEIIGELNPVIARTRLVVTLDPSLQQLPVMESDRKKLKQIISNLMSNALKFTPEGFVQLHGDYDAESDLVSISVADTGIGISEEEREGVFEEFTQSEQVIKRGYGGSGLGLSICRRFARSLGGELTLVSALGAGSTFTVTLPRECRDTGVADDG